MNDIEEEPGLVGLVKSEAALLVKEEVMADGWQDIADLQCGPSTSTIVGSMDKFDSIGDLGNILNVKEELGAIEIGPTVLQHMDTPGTTNQKDVSVVKQEHTINHNNLNLILCGGVKEEIIEDKWGADTDDQRSGKVSQSKQRARSQLYSCDKCVKTYTSKESLVQHYRNLHSTESHKCTKCQKKFPSKAYLYQHTSTVHSEQQYECAVCKKICKSKPALNMHVYHNHRPRPAVSSPVVHTCPHCHKTYACKTGLFHHIDVVHTKVLYRCSECNREFKGKHLLKSHVRKVHSKEEHVGSKARIYTCDYCKKMFTDKGDVRSHITVVHSSGSYKCHQCDKIFKCKIYLMQHKTRLHPAGLQIHTCDYCQKTFCYKAGLQQHTKYAHVAARTHRCRTCKKTFESSDELQRHNTSIHGKALYKCEVCLRLYTSKAILRKHFKKAHNSKEIQFKTDLSRHEMPDIRLTTDDLNAAASTSKQQHNVDVVKEEPADAELELGPVVFQHMDCNYRPYKEEPQDGSGGLM